MSPVVANIFIRDLEKHECSSPKSKLGNICIAAMIPAQNLSIPGF